MPGPEARSGPILVLLGLCRSCFVVVVCLAPMEALAVASWAVRRSCFLVAADVDVLAAVVAGDEEVAEEAASIDRSAVEE